jgi:hypothetical protein
MTRLDEALAGVTTLGFDTSPFIYFIERHPTYIVTTNLLSPREGIVMPAVSSYAESPFYHL